MSNTHKVAAGETLSGIARQHGTTVAELQQLNPIIRNPDKINAGWTLKLPAKDEATPATSTDSAASPATTPQAKHAADSSSSDSQPASKCTDPLVDVVHITGHEQFYVLSEKEQTAVKQEIAKVQKVMDQLHQSVNKAAEGPCAKEGNPGAKCSCRQCAKSEWLQLAQEQNLLQFIPAPPSPAQIKTEQRREELQRRLHTLNEALAWYEAYRQSLWDAVTGNDSALLLAEQKRRQLNIEIAAVTQELGASLSTTSPDEEAEDSETFSSSQGADEKYSKHRSVSHEQGISQRSGITVTEVTLFSQPDRRYYITHAFFEQVQWRATTKVRSLARQPFSRELANDLINDIQSAIKDDADSSPLGKLSASLGLWSSKEDCALNALHHEAKWQSEDADAAPYAVSAEAHALRFAASASAGVNSWNPSAGEIDVGVSGNAAFSLGEGCISMEAYLPSQGGYPLNICYRSINGELINYSFGAFRAMGKVELTCFAGARVDAELGASAQYKASEQSAGATALLDSPSLDTGPGGSVALRGNAFAGVQAGGSLTGALQWAAPLEGQADALDDWSSLAEVKVEGNVALGAGAGFDFGLRIHENKLVMTCKGSLVLGPGAGGGFGTEVDLEAIYDLIKLVCGVLGDLDYRYIACIAEDAFNMLAIGLFKVWANPQLALIDAFSEGQKALFQWWKERERGKAEAERIAQHILEHGALLTHEGKIPFGKLPPEVLGPALYLLSETWATSWEDEQESAIVRLLTGIQRWRHFIEILEHMSPDGRKILAMTSLERLHAILDGQQQREFIRFVHNLQADHEQRQSLIAWTPRSPRYHAEIRLAAQQRTSQDRWT